MSYHEPQFEPDKYRLKIGDVILMALILALFAAALSGCAVVSANRVFPKLTWYWSDDAKMQRAENAAEKNFNAENQNKKQP